MLFEIAKGLKFLVSHIRSMTNSSNQILLFVIINVTSGTVKIKETSSGIKPSRKHYLHVRSGKQVSAMSAR